MNYITHDYIYASGKLLRETITTTVDGEVTDTDVLDFYYDQNGRPYSFTYNGTEYYYILNLQGDVARIYDTDGTRVATYNYNAWGEIINQSGTMADINPIRYRGYYYDAELEMYYLQSRYYDPTICRFVNADALASTGQGFAGYNMFAYCINSPVNCTDSAGMDAIWIQEKDSAAENGHTGLLVQDEKGNWYYFYWGPADESGAILAMIVGVPARCVFEEIDTTGYCMQTLTGVVDAIGNSGNAFISERADDTTGIIYFEGDFSNTFDYLYDLFNSNQQSNTDPEYNLIFNNCVQVSEYALSLSDSTLPARVPLIPNVEFSYINATTHPSRTGGGVPAGQRGEKLYIC